MRNIFCFTKCGACRLLLGAFLLLWAGLASADEPKAFYQRSTGTVHQFGFIGGLSLTSNPNMSAYDMKETYTDYSLGVVYVFHDYLSPQLAFEVITSMTMMTANTLEVPGVDDNKLKFIWPVDCRVSLGPSEDFQMYMGGGLQWNVVNKSIGVASSVDNTYQSTSVHQLSGNACVGFNVLGPQKHWVHLSVGTKFHFPIVNNSEGSLMTSGQMVDLSKDKSCVCLTGGLTFDLDKRKSTSLMLNYEYPLGNSKMSVVEGASADGKFFSNTQMISLGLMFHLGGTR